MSSLIDSARKRQLTDFTLETVRQPCHVSTVWARVLVNAELIWSGEFSVARMTRVQAQFFERILQFFLFLSRNTLNVYRTALAEL